MALNKKNEFDPKLTEAANLAKALSHPARLAILKTLAERSECICGELVDTLPLAQATVSQHLKELKQMGLIKGEISGPKTCYCINYEVFNNASAKLDAFFKEIKSFKNLKKCC